jgi:hypothetical protein
MPVNEYQPGYTPSAIPKGLSHPGGISTMALVDWYNENTGQRYTGGGGYSADTGSGWRQVKSDSYDGQGKLVSQDPINMAGFVGPTYSAPARGVLTGARPPGLDIPSLSKLDGRS